MPDGELSFRKSANIDRVTDKRKDSLFRLVDTDGSGTIDAQEFAVLYDAIKKDLAEELEKEAALEKEASSAKRRFKMLLLFVAVLVSFLAASVAANFAVIFSVVDQAITTTTTSSGVLEVKGSDTIAKTAIATVDVPLIVAPVLDLDLLAAVKSLKLTYNTATRKDVRAALNVIGVRKHNATFVEFITDVAGETVEALNGIASLVRYPTDANGLPRPVKFALCASNATCSAFKASGIDVAAALELAQTELEQIGFHERRLDPYLDITACSSGVWTFEGCQVYSWTSVSCGTNTVSEAAIYYHSGYQSLRHVVFMLHGSGGDLTHMWGIYCITGSTPTCPYLELPAFQHLAFVFPTSGIDAYMFEPNPTCQQFGGWIQSWMPLCQIGSQYGGGYFNFGGPYSAWGGNLNDHSTYSEGGTLLANLVCGNDAWAAGLPCSGTASWLGGFNIGVGSEIMVAGFSNGGGLAAYMSLAYGAGAGGCVSGGCITKAVAIDYYGTYINNGIGQDWLTGAVATSGAAGFNLKVYSSCDSTYYTTDLITPMTPTHVFSSTFASVAGLVQDGPFLTYDYGGTSTATATKPYKEWSWTNPSDGRNLKWAVHGLAPGGMWNQCTENTMGSNSHGQVPFFTDLAADIAAWVLDPSAPAPPAPPTGRRLNAENDGATSQVPAAAVDTKAMVNAKETPSKRQLQAPSSLVAPYAAALEEAPGAIFKAMDELNLAVPFAEYSEGKPSALNFKVYSIAKKTPLRKMMVANAIEQYKTVVQSVLAFFKGRSKG